MKFSKFGGSLYLHFYENVVAADLVQHCMERLLNVADKMHRKFERFKLLLTGLATNIGLEPLKLCDDAVAIRVFCFAFSRRIIDVLLERDINEVPVRGFVM